MGKSLADDADWATVHEFLHFRRQGKEPGLALYDRAASALVANGGAPPSEPFSLRNYDSDAYGPFLGISNEGYGAALIAAASRNSPKAAALGESASPLTIGIGVDGEVLGAIGEVPIGPDEFARIWLNCADRTLMTTNVGARVNPRIYRAPFCVTVDLDGADGLEAAKQRISATFAPFVAAPGGARPLLLFVDFTGDIAMADGALAELRAFVTEQVAASDQQRLGLRLVLTGVADDEARASAAINLAASAEVRDVAFDGITRRAADRAISLPALLNYIDRDALKRLLAKASASDVTIRPFNHLDADTVARQVWSTLNTARSYGLHLGKYGLVPMTLEESEVVVECIQRWLGHWSAAPVCYVDRDIVTAETVFHGETLGAGIGKWLEMVARHDVPLVLIDTVDKAEGRKILKTGNDPKGLLEIDEIRELDELGRRLGVKVMWAGGITRDQALEFGKIGVFGIYVTTAVSDRAAVSGIYLNDPGLDAAKQPNADKIRDVKTLIEAGFLIGKLDGLSAIPKAAELRQKLLSAERDSAALGAILPAAWQLWWDTA